MLLKVHHSPKVPTMSFENAFLNTGIHPEPPHTPIADV